MAMVDKYGNFNLAMLKAICEGMSLRQLELVLRFADFLMEIDGRSRQEQITDEC